MGRKEISQMTFFNFVSAISIGTIGGSLVINNQLSIRNGLIALVGWTAFTLAIAYLDIKSMKSRKLIEGEPIIVIKNGMIMEKALQKTQLDIDALRVMLREKSIFSLKDVDYAIFETDGKLSVMKKENKMPVTKSEMNIQPSNKIFPFATEVISDGAINTNNLSRLNLNEQWLNQQLQQSGVQSVSDVFYAEIQTDGTLYIDTRGDNLPENHEDFIH